MASLAGIRTTECDQRWHYNKYGEAVAWAGRAARVGNVAHAELLLGWIALQTSLHIRQI